MNKIILTIAVGCFSMAHSQNLNFTDAKFKALLLSSSPANQIAKDLNGNAIAIDANGDGEIQVSEAVQVKILTLKQDQNQMYLDPNGNIYDPNNLNTTYYNSHLPDGISDALLFPNMEELYFWDVKSANINFTNNNKIKKVQGRPIYYTISQSSLNTNPSPINLSVDNCSSIQNISDIIAYQATMNPWSAPENSLTIKNCPQINGDIFIGNAELKELSIENCSVTSLTFNLCKYLEKVSVPNLNTLTKISVLGVNSSSSYLSDQNIQLVANNCTNLQEIIADTDHYNSTGAYFSSINLNGCINLKKIKGLNAPSVDLSTAGLTNLEELDCSFYNRYIYNGHQDGFVYLGNMTSLNISNLPKLKILKAFNQPIANNVNFSVASKLENIDITNSCASMNTVTVNDLPYLHTLKTNTIESASLTFSSNLQKISVKNCALLSSIIFSGNDQLKELDLQNCPSMQRLSIGYYAPMRDGIFYELNSVNLQQCPGMKEIYIYNTKISTLNTSQCPALKYLDLQQNSLLSSVDILGNINLQSLSISSSPLPQINTTNNINLEDVGIFSCPQITQLNFSTAPHLRGATLINLPILNYVNLRNGSIEEYHDYSNYSSNLSMCVDDAQLIDLQASYPDINFTTTCGNFLNTKEISKTEIKIAPNPVKDFVMIKAGENIKNVKIYDAQGKMTLNQDLDHEMMKINLSEYHAGIYIIKVKTDKTEISKKIIKE